MVKLVVLEGWIKKTLRGVGPVGVYESYDVIANKREPHPETFEERTIVLVFGGAREPKLDLWFCGMIFNDVGCLLNYEACNVSKYISEDVLKECARRFEENRKEGVEWTMKNVVSELEKHKLMLWWFKKVM